jgi:DNA-binding CsgD family transcriptional regulator
VFVSDTRATVARLLAEGRTVAQIARATGLATNTVRYHRDRLRAAVAAPPADVVAAASEPDAAISHVETRERVAGLLALGVSRAETARRRGNSKATVSYHARRLGQDVDARFARRYDWVEVQRFYDAGHGVAECVEAFGFSKQTWHAAVNAGRVVPRPTLTPIATLCAADTPRSRGNLKRRLLREGLKEARCEGCGLHRWQGHAVPLALHCHALTANFSGRKRRVHADDVQAA